MPVFNAVILGLEGLVYSLVLIGLLHLRHRIGTGVFITVLASMHFLETYLAATIYVELPIGFVSPGSTVLFAGKLMMILLLYIREDAPTVRQLIYGLFIGNLLAFGLGLIISLHGNFSGPGGKPANFDFLGHLDFLMLWGTTLLYLDSLAIILVYERLATLVGRRTIPRFFLAGSLILAFDQVGFYGMLHFLTGAPIEVFWASLVTKLAMAVLFSLCAGVYLRYFSSAPALPPLPGLKDLFNDLTYREKYQALLSQARTDALTGIGDRGALDHDGPTMIREAIRLRHDISLLIVDADHFKAVNDRHGHLRGDEVLRDIAATLSATMRANDGVYRFGGEEFVILAPGMNHGGALHVAERIRSQVSARVRIDDVPVTVSIGVATAPGDGLSLVELVAMADKRLYQAKEEGRDRIRGA